MVMSFCVERETALASTYEHDGQHRGSVPYVILQWTHSGVGEFEMRGRKYAVGPGKAFISIVPEAACYRYPCEGRAPWMFSWINIVGDYGVELWRTFREKFGPVNALAMSSPAGNILAQLLADRSAGTLQDAYETNIALYKFYNEWWRQLAGGQAPEPEMARVAQQYFDERYAEPVNVKELAARAGCSREHFTRQFMQEVGEPPAQYLRARRLEAGRRMLDEGELSLQEIARRSGFASVRQFRRAYANRYGTMT